MRQDKGGYIQIESEQEELEVSQDISALRTEIDAV